MEGYWNLVAGVFISIVGFFIMIGYKSEAERSIKAHESMIVFVRNNPWVIFILGLFLFLIGILMVIAGAMGPGCLNEEP